MSVTTPVAKLGRLASIELLSSAALVLRQSYSLCEGWARQFYLQRHAVRALCANVAANRQTADGEAGCVLSG